MNRTQAESLLWLNCDGHRRQVQQRRGEDDRDDAGLVDLERDVGGAAAEHLAADHPAGVLHRDPALRLLDEDDGRDDRRARSAITMRRPTSPCPCRPPTASAGKVATTWVKIRIDMPLPMPRSVISSPSHMITAVPAVIVMTMTRNVAVPSSCSSGRAAALQQVAGAGQRDDAGGLQQRQAQGQVAGVLGDLGLAGLALLLQRLQPRDHHDEQLQDDAGGDVRHDPQREDRQLQQRATREQVDQAVDARGPGPGRGSLTLATSTPVRGPGSRA